MFSNTTDTINILIPYFIAKSDPFSVQFNTDAFEVVPELTETVADAKAGSGFQLAYFMSSNNC